MKTSPEPTKTYSVYNQSAVWSFWLGPLAASIPLLALWLVKDSYSDTAATLLVYSILCCIPFVFACLITGIIALVQIKRERQTHAGKAGGKGAWMAVIGLVFGSLEFGFLLYILIIFF